MEYSESDLHNKVILNYVSPGSLRTPTPGMSVLKNYINSNGFSSSVIYWNLKLVRLQCAFIWSNNIKSLDDDRNAAFLFFNYLAIKEGDKRAYLNVKAKLMSLKPNFITSGVDFYDKHMNFYAEQLDVLIDEIIGEICSPDILCYGFSISMYQWICSSIIARKIKYIYPDSKIVIGGIGNKEAATCYLNNFEQFDFAIWGEGENAFLDLCKQLRDKNNCFETIPNLAFRLEDEIIVSKNKKTKYVPLSELSIRPDYSDYFEQKKAACELSQMYSEIGVETSRSCHWKHCHFCYLNTGYKYRTKPVDIIYNEIIDCINEYEIFTFNFLDNDIIGNDFERFDQLLDKLIEIKGLYPDFNINMAEIITKGVTAPIIRKMAMAGFNAIQIGYESASENLLKKIKKKNTFASNLLVIKFASIYRIDIPGANIIRGLLEETDGDILQAIYNLHYLRFFIKNGAFRHSMTNLHIMHPSRYYKKIEQSKSHWPKSIFLERFIPSGYLKEDIYNDIVPIQVVNTNPLWDNFESAEEFYIQNSFEYLLIDNKDYILYKELQNGNTISEFELTQLDWLILRTANERVINIETLLDTIRKEISRDYLDVDLINVLEDLKTERLLYISEDYQEILSIINTTQTI